MDYRDFEQQKLLGQIDSTRYDEQDQNERLRELLLGAIAKNKQMLQEEKDKRKEKRMLAMQVAAKGACLRCGNKERPKYHAKHLGQNGPMCEDVWACEWDAFVLPCCQYCHEQFHPEAHSVCPKGQVDPWGNQPHIPGGKFWTQDQKQQESAFEINLETKLTADEYDRIIGISRDVFAKNVDAELKKKLEVADFFCPVCGRTDKPKRPTKCLECNRIAGWRKGYGLNDLKRPLLSELKDKERDYRDYKYGDDFPY